MKRRYFFVWLVIFLLSMNHASLFAQSDLTITLETVLGRGFTNPDDLAEDHPDYISQINDLDWHPNGTQIATAHGDPWVENDFRIRIWNVPNGTVTT
ncbi:MAG: hypothetical protein JXA10_18065, partial [Anaerolineae bacterium]|nr:hypothetical protein [Anaerolineae bacterium]